MAAWLDMFNHVSSLIANCNLSYQTLETAMWIETNDGGKK